MNFLKALLLFLKIYRDGFFFSGKSYRDPDGSRWGFYRFNEEKECGLFDIDYSFSKDGSGYFHVHGNDFRMERRKKDE